MHDLHRAVLMREHRVTGFGTHRSDSRQLPFLTVIDPLQRPRGCQWPIQVLEKK